MRKYFFLLLCSLCYLNGISQIKINEFSSNNGYIDEDSDNADWIEIINTSDSTVQLSNYYLSDKINELDKWQLPNETLESMGIILICASGKDRNYRTRHWESIILAENEWEYFIGNEEPDSNWKNNSFNSDWTTGPGGFGYGDNDDNTTISLPNNVVSIYLRKEFDLVDIDDLTRLALHADYDDSFVAYLNGVEIMRSDNITGYLPAYNVTADWDHEAALYWGGEADNMIFNKEELNNLLSPTDNILAIQVHNVSTTSSDMSSNFFLSAGINSDNYFYQDTPEWFNLDTTSIYHTNFKLSNNEHVIISNMNGYIVDSTAVNNNLSTGLSKGRSPDGVGEWCYFDTPTPDELNGDSWCYIGITPEPELLPSGWYDVGDSALTINISSSVDAEFYYTTNGDVPTYNDEIYTEPISFNTTTVLSIKALGNENWLPSKLIDRTYIINQDNYELPVFSVFTDSANLWDEEEGIYIFGSVASSEYPYFGSNFWEPWSRWSRLEYFDGDKVKRAEEEFDLEIHGGWSRSEPQKSFRFDFKSSYTGPLEWPLIPQKDFIQSFNNINLRNGGQHTYSDKIQDAVISRVIQETHADNMAYEPCILYLNGEYWGIYGIREKIDEHYVEDNYGYDDSEVDLLNSWNTLAGSDVHFFDAYDQIMMMDNNADDYYNFVNSKFDLDNFKDYFIIQTYIQNSDWMGIWWALNNTKLWRPQTEDGRWRYVIYDTDAAFGYFGTWLGDNYIDYARNTGNAHANLFDNLLNNDQFQCEFINRYADLINTTFEPSYVVSEATEIRDYMYDGMQDHIDRWQWPDAWDASYWANGLTTISSLQNWVGDIESVLYYNYQRIDYARQNIVDEFDLDGQYDVELDVFPNTSGTINISTINPTEYPWDGVYFNSCPITISATPEPGYIFDHWEFDFDEGNTPPSSLLEDSLSQNLELSIDQNISFTAHFIECDEDNDEVVCPPAPCEIGVVYISEAHNLGDPSDYIEIHNSGDHDCSLLGFMLDDEQPFNDYTFNDTIIPAGGYWIGYEDDPNSFSSGLNSNGETIYFGNSEVNTLETIINPVIETEDGILLSQSFDNAGNGCYSIPSPGFENNDCFIPGCMNPIALNYDNTATYDDGSCEYDSIDFCEIGTVYISELHNMGDPDDYIEIYNSGDSDCLLTGLMLDDEQPFNDYTFGNIIIESGGYWLGYEDGINSFNSGLSNNGETIYFGDNLGNILSLVFQASDTTLNGVSLAQNFDQDGNGCYAIPSPGVINNPCLIEGCTDPNATNYDETVNYDNGSCEFPDIIYGCTDTNACNYNIMATNNNDSCSYECIGCTDTTACNYEPNNTIDDGSCEYELDGYDCSGNCLVDTDGDSVCDMYEVFGCTDTIACNYSDNATENDESCIYSIETYLDCENNCINDIDEDGVCDEIEILGCTDTVSCNYDPDATDEGICTYPIETYLDCNNTCINDIDNDGVCDEIEILGCTDSTACNYNPNATELNDSCLFVIDCETCENGQIINNDQDLDGICDNDEVPGCTDFLYVEYNPLATDDDGSCLTIALNGCTDALSCNYNPLATDDDGSCYNNDVGCGCDQPGADFGYDCNGNCLIDTDGDDICDEFEIIGCTDTVSCNYDPDATDEGICTYPIETYLDCDNNCINDTDGDGVCDEIEIIGCTDTIACNYDADATDEGICTYPIETYLDCDNNCINDTDGDGVCDEVEIIGCTDTIACNYDSDATDEGICTYPIETYLDCDNNCINDTDGDGVCDELEIAGCTILYACNYNSNATENDGSCDFSSCSGCLNPNACNYCPECTLEDNITCIYPITLLDCNGNCINDVDSDGICDELDGCVGEYDECDICNGDGAEIYYDCDGNCINDIDGDLICDENEIEGCMDTNACNYDDSATENNDNCILPGDPCIATINENGELIYGTYNEDCICIENNSSIEEEKNIKQLIRISDILGRDVAINGNKNILLYIYSDGSVEKKYLVK